MRIKIITKALCGFLFFSIFTLGYSQEKNISDYIADIIFQHAQSAIEYVENAFS